MFLFPLLFLCSPLFVIHSQCSISHSLCVLKSLFVFPCSTILCCFTLVFSELYFLVYFYFYYSLASVTSPPAYLTFTLHPCCPPSLGPTWGTSLVVNMEWGQEGFSKARSQRFHEIEAKILRDVVPDIFWKG